MLRLRTFGGLTLERDGVPATGPSTQRRRLAVLALLASAPNGGMSRERLAAFLWPDADESRARHSLDDALSALRRDLGVSPFLGIATLRLDPAVVGSDVAERAEALREGHVERAVALYGGPFLDGFGVPGSVEFEQWVELERARRHAEQERALERLASDATARGDTAAAAQWWSARVALDPLDTRAMLRLLDAQVACGNVAEALRLARVHETVVKHSLDTTPGPEWATAVERLRRRLTTPPVPAAARVSSAEPASSGAPSTLALAAPVAPTTLVASTPGTSATSEASPATLDSSPGRGPRYGRRRLLTAAALVASVLAAGALWSRANLRLNGHTSWDIWRYTHTAIPLGTGSRTLRTP